MRRRNIALLFGLLAVGLEGIPAQAQLRIDAVELGFNGRYVPEYLTPVVISLSNTIGAPMTLELEIFQEVRDFEGGTSVERLRLPVDLGPGTHKSFTLDFPIRGASTLLHIRLLTQGHQIVHTEVDLRERWSDALFSLGLGLYAMTGVEAISPAKLPKRWTSYESVRRIYWGRLDPARLSPEQRAALHGWLLRGGELIVLGGANWYEQAGPAGSLPSPRTAQGWWASLMPIRNVRVARKDFDGRQVLWLEGELRAGAKVLEELSGRPLWWERSVGLGRVLLSALDEPVLKFLSNVDERRIEDVQLIEGLLGRTIVPAPSREVLSALLVLFVGGFSLGGLWALRRPRAALLLPIWAVFISLLLFGYLQAPEFSGGSYSLELSLILSWAGEPLALEQSWYGLFSRRTQDQALSVSSDLVKALRPASRAPRNTALTATGEHLLLFQSVHESVRLFKAERFVNPQIEFSLDRSISPPYIRVYNNSGKTFKGAIVHVGGKFYILGTVAAKARLVHALEELGTITEDEWLQGLPEVSRALWRQWESFLSDPALGAWDESLDGSSWAMADTERRASFRLILVSGARE